MPVQRILVTPGEPGGIGPDLICQIAQRQHSFELCAVADPDLLHDRAERLGLPLNVQTIEAGTAAKPQAAGSLTALPISMTHSVRIGVALPEHASYVLACLDAAVDACQSGAAGAMVTGPINKASIVDAGFDFSGHTEYLAKRTATERVVMMLASDVMRVALVTTHLPLQKVSAAITADDVTATASIVLRELRTRFSVDEPVVAVCGLNPHAGEQGHLGHEETDTIGPACEQLRAQGVKLLGPLPADTAFTPKILQQVDAVIAMYHDQGLPVIKYASFGSTVNVTLGLPIIRTSVDHGTALDIAGSGKASDSSLRAAIAMAVDMAARQGVH